MCKNVESEAPYTHFMQPRHEFTLGEEAPDPMAEAVSQAPGEE